MRSEHARKLKKKGEEKENEAAAARVHDQRDELLHSSLCSACSREKLASGFQPGGAGPANGKLSAPGGLLAAS